MLINYTWAHCIGDVYDQQTTSAGVSPNVPIGGVSPVNGVGFPTGDRNFYRENCQGSDIRQSLGISAVATMPKFSNNALRMVASGWQVAPLMYFRSAQLYTVTSGIDNALTGEAGQTPNYNGTSPYATSTAMHAGALCPVAYQRRGFVIFHPRPGHVRKSGLQQHKRAR